MEMTIRPRRLRLNSEIRSLARETRASPASLIYPLFVREGKNVKSEIISMPGQYHYSPDTISAAVERCLKLGVDKVLLFGLPNHKDKQGSQAWAENGVAHQAIAVLKGEFPNLLIVSDVCLCEYTSHGHCGVLTGEVGHECVDNDQTLELLSKTAVSLANAGADVIAPSDMMDGRVGAIRRALDARGFENVALLSYAVKYASAFYGPFRDAAGSAPAFGDRKSYQMDWHNVREALREAALDEAEGADMLMVKPAMSYLDVIAKVKEQSKLPLAAYSVSGEYAMMKLASTNGLIDEYAAMCEAAAGVFRAGADVLISYFAPELAGAIKKGDLG